MKINALIFDMDGTLVHNMHYHNQAWNDTLAEAGVQIDMDEFHRSTSGMIGQEIIRRFIGANLKAEEVDYWFQRKEALYRERYACCREPVDGLLNLLEQARSLGLPMAVATAAPPDNITFVLDELNLRRYFDVVIGGHQIKRGKPDPEIFLMAAQQMGVEPGTCLVFEDALGGIEAARRAGMQAILICTTMLPQDVAGMPHVLQAVPDFTHFDLAALQK